MGLLKKILGKSKKKEVIAKEKISYSIDKNKVDFIIEKMKQPKPTEELKKEEQVYIEYISPSKSVIKESNIDIYNVTKKIESTKPIIQIPIILGKDTNEEYIIDDLRDLKNILIAGATGTGKSILLHSIITTIISTTIPNKLKLLLIDYKSIEFSRYNNIPHLLIPVVTDVKKSIGVLSYIIQEMNNRYNIFIKKGVKDIYGYNEIVEKNKIPEILIVIDDILDLMRINPVEVGLLLEQILSKAKDTGIYMIIASQSVAKTVIPESIKNNILNRISFKVVTSKESIAILDKKGAENILEIGTLLYKKYNSMIPRNLKGINLEVEQLQKILDDIARKNLVKYDTNILEKLEEKTNINIEEGDVDEFLIEAIDTTVETGQVSTSFIQRRLKIGYAEAGRIIEKMEKLDIISGYADSKPRSILLNKEEWKLIKKELY